MTVKISLIVAMAENRCIGVDNKMPWHISDDLKRFKALTTGHAVIMGRKTFDSIIGYLKKPLPERTNIVISRSEFKSNTNFDSLAEEKLEVSDCEPRGSTKSAWLTQDCHSKKNNRYKHEVCVFKNILSAISHGKEVAKGKNQGEIFIIGGAQIYEQSIQYADRLYLTKIHKSIDGDAFFPEISDNKWLEKDKVDHFDHDPPYSFITLERKS